MYTIAMHMPERLLEVKYIGLLTVDEVAALRSDIIAQLDMYRLGPALFVTLVDTTECAIQPQEVHEALSRFGTDGALMPARCAVWTGDSTSRMQTRRAHTNCDTHLFRDRADALAWLAEAELMERAA
jgi:hypothetical protein